MRTTSASSGGDNHNDTVSVRRHDRSEPKMTHLSVRSVLDGQYPVCEL